jgi:2-methylcitrate dehydratase PrpD
MQADLVSNSRAIAQFVAANATRTPPAKVLDAARMCLVDWVGVCTGAHSEKAGQIVRTVAASWGQSGRSTLLLGGQGSALVAALCNGTLAHCLDFDDTYIKGNTHTSAPLWAATLALGEQTGATEQEILNAFITGFEVSARVGRGLGEAVTARGFHATGVFGRLGAAAACAALLRLDADSCQHALGLAATQAGGLTGSFGTMSKPFHAGKAAMDGVLSAQMAAAGFKAAIQLLDPNGGLDGAIIQDKAFAISPANFDGWEILENSFKPYAACHLTHPAIDAARGAGVQKKEIGGIQEIEVHAGALAHQVTGGKTGSPSNALEGKFDIRYCVALALHGRRLSATDFMDPLHGDEDVRRTAGKVRPLANERMGYTSAAVKIKLRDGSVRDCEVPVAKGHPGNPMGWTDMQAKFEGLVEPAAGAQTQGLFGHLRDFGSNGGRGVATIRLLSAALQDR